MKLRELLVDAEVAEVVGDAGAEVTSLAYDSRTVEPGTLFFCVPGQRSDGHEFGERAVERGAGALVVERLLDLGVTQVRVADSRAAMAPVAVRFWDDPTAKLRVAGVTGTNGKTTTAFLIRHLLSSQGIQDRAPGDREADRRRSRGGGGADHARGDRPPADLPPHARRGRRGLRDGGLLPRPGAGTDRGRPLRGRRVHQPDPGPPRLPRRHGGVLPGQARALFLPLVAPGDGDRERRRCLRGALSGRTAEGRRTSLAHLFCERRGRRRLPGRGGLLRRRGVAVPVPRSGWGGAGADAVARPLQRRERAGGDRRLPRAGGAGRGGGRRPGERRPASRGASSPSTRGSPSRSWSTTRTPRTR